ncbi:MAG TPA: TIGR02266 family protein [Polyangiaceae bacterium]|nr:TIGR02266 family protein [Polyangiaceae bacterium]
MTGSDDAAPESDRRRAMRAPIELKVEYKRLNTFFADYTRNISRGGTFIGTEKPLAVGTEFVFALLVPRMGEPLRLRGKVIWTTSVQDATRGNPAGMGIEFQYTDNAERHEKEAAVERLLIDQLGEHLATKLLGRKPQT